MNQLVDTEDYGFGAKLFHWGIVLLVVVQFALAWTMPEIHRDTKPDTLISLHLSVGALIILVMLLRLVWRLLHPTALITEGVPGWQLLSARLTHLALYGLLVIMPVLGWINANARGWDVSLFGVVPLPGLIAPHTPFGHLAGDIHSTLAYVVLGLIGLHVVAALYHHFFLRDRTLTRMLPR